MSRPSAPDADCVEVPLGKAGWLCGTCSTGGVSDTFEDAQADSEHHRIVVHPSRRPVRLAARRLDVVDIPDSDLTPVRLVELDDTNVSEAIVHAYL